MPSKAEFYRQMAEQVSTRLVGSWKEWTAFLTTAARLYKYPFHEQMMIYAQRPDATACAEYDLWTEKMGRYVRRGSKGIALVDDSGDKLRLRYEMCIRDRDKALPELSEGQTLPLSGATVKEGKTTPPKHFTEDTLRSAMETAGKDDMPEDAERKGLGTPATRAGILEKLVSTGFLERKKSKKTVQLMPSHDAVSLITVLPEQLQSPLLTAEWEYRLGEIERGELAPEDFMAGISAMLKELVGTYQAIKGTEYLFSPSHEVVGKCPRCGGEVAEMQKGFFCQTESCKFAIWKNNKWWEMKHKQPTKAIVTALLKDGRAHVRGLYSEKTGKTYDATVVLADDGQYANFKLEFDQQKGGKR